MGNSNIMRFKNEDDFNKELNPGWRFGRVAAKWRPTRTTSTPFQTKYDTKGEGSISGSHQLPLRLKQVLLVPGCQWDLHQTQKSREGASLNERENLKNKLKLKLTDDQAC
jgi:phage gpG-like protein